MLHTTVAVWSGHNLTGVSGVGNSKIGVGPVRDGDCSVTPLASP